MPKAGGHAFERRSNGHHTALNAQAASSCRYAPSRSLMLGPVPAYECPSVNLSVSPMKIDMGGTSQNEAERSDGRGPKCLRLEAQGLRNCMATPLRGEAMAPRFDLQRAAPVFEPQPAGGRNTLGAHACLQGQACHPDRPHFHPPGRRTVMTTPWFPLMLHETKHHSRVMTSSRFNTTFITAVIAASSTVSISSARGDSPTDSSSSAAAALPR